MISVQSILNSIQQSYMPLHDTIRSSEFPQIVEMHDTPNNKQCDTVLGDELSFDFKFILVA